ncbi:glycosyltransferase family 4 protein [Halodesulfurarchaeum sp. HSR-GB]|uniref:glycosyltransferase family 4 protein n=1 Tax=Halodesulfurarchaeum sp. HSR-GB TaxID=3074077 RepID=UPI002855B300|nr:glycosyltransferase family 4 protein [Halodesulfurarchaeum sp. HSR-GB]MDR5657037.1 glycosyltransferase family 4 protein [Halodesulfurarchaeum sp. HSR-GB]
MRVSHYFEWEQHITGGHAQSVKNQRTMLDRAGIEYTTRPSLDVDLLHLNNMGPRSLLAAKRAQAASVPVLIHTHQTAEDFEGSFALSDFLAKPLRPYLEYAYDQGDHLICPSEYNQRTIRTYTDTPSTVISNGYDPEKIAGFESLRETYLDRYDLSPPVVFNVGHVIPRKGLETFVETARRLPDLDFAWFGFLNPTGGHFDRILRSRETERLVESAPENVTFTGYIEDIRGAYAAGDIFFFPTHNENEGMALLEAMAAGAPPVVRDIPTFEWLDEGRDCLKAETDFVPAIESLLSEKRRAEIGAQAKARSEAFTLDAVQADLVSLYRAIVGE